MIKKTRLKLFAAPVIGLLTGTFISILAGFGLFQETHLRFSDELFSRNQPSPDILIVAIDEKSLSDQNGLGRWQNWSRTYYAQVIRNLVKNEAKVIGIDVIFPEKSSGISEKKLLEAIENNSLEQTALKTLSTDHPDDLELAEALTLSDNIILAELHQIEKDPKNNQFISLSRTSSLQILEKNARTAPIQTFADSDDIIRKIPLKINYRGQTKESFFLAAAKLFLPAQKHITTQIPTDQGYFIINFSSKPYSFETVSFSDVYKDKIPSEKIKNKIVLIGAIDATLQDRFFVPTSKNGIPMPGIEIHANAIQTVLESNYLKHQQTSYLIAIIFIIGLLSALAFAFSSTFGSVAILIGLILLYTVAIKISYEKGLIIHTILPYLTIAATYIGILGLRYFTEYKEKKFIKKAFKQYLNPTIVSEITKNPALLKLGGEKREISIFFSDLAGFTTLCESLAPEKTVEILNQYLGAFSTQILAHGGTLDKYEGDAIMAFFGAPLNQTDHPIKIVQAALACQKAFDQLSAQWQSENLPALDFRIGINSGAAIVGNMGSENRFNYTAMGDAVNIAARLESINKTYQTRIMVSESTYLSAKENFSFRKVDNVILKGKTKPIWIYELLCQKE